jgi:hypothetical protein
MMWRLGCGGVDKAALCGLRWQHAGVLISPKIKLHPILLVILVGNLLPAEVRYAVLPQGRSVSFRA